MAQPQSFEHEFADTTTPGVIMDKLGSPVQDGQRVAEWIVPQMGAKCMLHYFDQHRSGAVEEPVVTDQPHYLLHAKYDRNDGEAMLLIRFINGHEQPLQGVRKDGFEWRQNDEREWYKVWLQARIHPEEAEWVAGILMREGEKAAWEAVPSTPALQVVGEEHEQDEPKRSAFPPTDDPAVLARRRELGWI